MLRSRWGGFRAGFNRYKSWWTDLRTPDAVTQSVEAPVTPTGFDYTTAQGIWNLNSTVQFYKGNTPPETGDGGGSAPTYVTGFSDSLDTITGQSASWSQRTVDISAYAGATVRVVFHYTNGSSFTGDIQLDYIVIDGENIYNFENTGDGFERNSALNPSTYTSVSWETLPSSGGNNGQWLVDAGGTPSSSTGLGTAAAGSYYIYAETSSPADASGYNFWLRSPQITLSSTPTLTYYEARSGAGIGTLNVHLDVIA